MLSANALMNLLPGVFRVDPRGTGDGASTSTAGSPSTNQAATPPMLIPIPGLRLPTRENSLEERVAAAELLVNIAKMNDAQHSHQQQHYGFNHGVIVAGRERETAAAVEQKNAAAAAAAAKEKQQAENAAIDLISRLMPVPACSICGADSTGIHFGVEACAACSAFFRRTVVLQKNYLCTKDGNCLISRDAPGAQKCRACRFKKCNRVGMDPSAVQHRRDAIGRHSTLIKRECVSPDSGMTADQCQSPPSPKTPRMAPSTPKEQPSVLEEMLDRYASMNQMRKIFYASECLEECFDETFEGAKLRELSDFAECMYQLWKVEPRICANFIAGNRFLINVPPKDRARLLKNFLIVFQAIEEPYLTWLHGGLEKKWWIMPNRTYMDLDQAEVYFENFVMKSLKLDMDTAIKIFKPSFQHAMDLVGEQMRCLNISRTEFVALAAIALFDPTLSHLSEPTRDLMQRMRDQLFRELLNHYEADDDVSLPEVRFGNLLLLFSSVKIHAQRTMENMHLLKFFDVIPRDKLFDQLCGID